MKLPETGTSRPVFTLMLFLAIFMFGTLAYRMLPRDVLPEIELPALTIVTVYPGASAEDVEREVTSTLEDILAGTPDLRKIFSVSKENVSLITMQFEWHSDLEAAANIVNDFIEFERSELPSEAERPVVMRVSSDMFPVMIYGVNAVENYENLGNIIDQQIGHAIKRVSGVGTLLIMGEPEREVKVKTDPFRMKAYNLSIEQLAMALRGENVSVPAGNIILGEDELFVTVPGEWDSLEEMERTVLSRVGDEVVRLEDVARVETGLRDAREVARVDGVPAVSLFVLKQPGANILEVVEEVKKVMEEVKPQLPPDVSIEELMDNSELVTFSLRNLTITIFNAGIIVILVVLFFLRKIRSSLIIILTIPFSLIVAFIFMYFADFTVNVFSLMSLAITLGMVIDNAIVVLENISSHLERGVAPAQASVFGTREMGLAITAATLTTLAVFFPLIFMGGVVGIMFRQLAAIASVTLLASLFTALMFTPMLCSVILQEKEKQTRPNRFFRFGERFFEKLEAFYIRILKYSLSHKIFVIIIGLVLFSLALFSTRYIGTDYIPEFDAGDISVVAEIRIGASTEQTLQVTEKIEQIFREEIPEMRALYSLTGQSEEGMLGTVGFREGKNVTSVFARMTLPQDRKRTADEVAEQVRKRVEQLPEVEKFSVAGGSLISDAIMGNIRPIQINVTGTDLDMVNETAQMIYDTLHHVNVLTNLENTIDRGKPELQVVLDKEKASALGLNTAMVSSQLRQSLHGQEAGTFRDGDESIRIFIRYDERHRSSLGDLENIMIMTLYGEKLPLSSVGAIKEAHGQMEVRREQQQRVVYVYANPLGVSLGEAVEQTRKAISDIPVPEGVDIEFGGEVMEQQEAFEDLWLMFVIGLVLVFMVMASLFESVRQPFIIIFTIPLSVIGVILIFLITGQTFNVVTFLGLIMLLGIVVNNGIVLVNYTNLLRNRGYDFAEAIIEGGRSRLRPVLMISFTTIFGMLPLAISTGMGSEIWSPLGITIIGGMIISSLITLLLIPVVYSLMNK